MSELSAPARLRPRCRGSARPAPPMWRRDGDRRWACVYPAHPAAGGCPALRRGSAPAFALARPIFHFPFQKSKSCCLKPGSPLRYPAGAERWGSGTAYPSCGQLAGHGRTQRRYSPVRPCRARCRQVPAAEGVPARLRAAPRPAIPGHVTRWSLAPGMLLPSLGEPLRGGSYLSPLLTKRLGETILDELKSIPRFKLQIEFFLLVCAWIFSTWAPPRELAQRVPLERRGHTRLGVFRRICIFKGIAADFSAVHPK